MATKKNIPILDLSTKEKKAKLNNITNIMLESFSNFDSSIQSEIDALLLNHKK